jgi:hypothetical protein
MLAFSVHTQQEPFAIFAEFKNCRPDFAPKTGHLKIHKFKKQNCEKD